ncbi:MAG: homocysteine S-methyltransferase family protein [candidate division WOR-3 bacterium]
MEFLGLQAPVLADGAIGEYLYSLGFPRDYLASEAIARAEGLLRRIHEEYVAAGSVMITTNTFDANAEKLDKHGLAERCREINAKAVRIARESGAKLVAGSVGPLDSGLTYSFAPRHPSRLREAYLPQLEGLLDEGVDLILIETQVDPFHAREIFNIARSLSSDIPVVLSFTFGPDLLTPAGFSLEEALNALEGLEPFAFGANHGIGPMQGLDIYARLLALSPFPITLMPNSGAAKMMGSIPVFPNNPEHFARCLASCAGERTAVLGGCCGTDPRFIMALRNALSSREKRAVRFSFAPEEVSKATPARVLHSRFSESLSGKEAIVIEVLPPRDADADGFMAKLDALKTLSPSAISLPDSPMGRVRATPSLLGVLVKERLGIEPLVHFALRDRNLTRVQSELVGLSALGITNLFVVAGDPPSLGDYPQSAAAYELSTEDALKLISQLGMGRDMKGRPLGRGAFLFTGSALSLSDQGARDKLMRRWDLGARFFITQPVYSPREIDAWEREMLEYPILVSLMPFRSKAQAIYMAREVPGISVPDDILRRIEEMEDEHVLPFSADLLSGVAERLKGLASGIYLSGPKEGIRELVNIWRT